MLLNIVIGIGLVVLGFVLGATCIYILEKKTIDRLIENCAESRTKLADMVKEEEKFLESLWPKHRHIAMETNLADYLKAKYLSEETECESDCEDESDNLYI